MRDGKPALAAILLGAGPDHENPALIEDCVALIEQHIAARSGLKGMALRTGLSMAKTAKPGILPRALGNLLPQFTLALEPLYQGFLKAGESDFAAWLIRHEGEATRALLGVADRRMGSSPNAGLKAIYARLRGGAESEISAVLPALAGVLSAHLHAL